MKVEQLMKHPVRTCQAEDSLDAASQLMWEGDCGSLPVVDADGRAIAMITDRDICMAAHFQGGPLRALKVRTAMSQDLHACAPSDPIATCEDAMRTHQLRRLPVLDDAGRVIGIVSLNDLVLEADAEGPRLAKEITLAEVAGTLGAICKRPAALAAVAS
jgi:CBS-domain-containing membrane protein